MPSGRDPPPRDRRSQVAVGMARSAPDNGKKAHWTGQADDRQEAYHGTVENRAEARLLEKRINPAPGAEGVAAAPGRAPGEARGADPSRHAG